MRVLATSLRSDDLGLPSRLLPIAAELRRRGHEVAFANPEPAPAKLIAGAGFRNLDCPQMRVWEAKVFAAPTPLVRDYDHFLALMGWRDPEFTARQIEDCVAVLRSWRPDVVLDSFDAGWCAATRILGLPLVEVLQADLHPDGRGFTWWLPPAPAPGPAEAFGAVLARAGLPPVDKAARLLIGSATVVAGSPATDPVPNPALPHVGALGWGNPAAELPGAVPMPGRRPLVFLYGGKPRYSPLTPTWGDSAIVLDTCVQALADLDADVVLGAGYQALPRSLPDNFIPVDYAPGQALARRADVMIHHGGHGSTLTALAAGTPALIIPTYSERESNARHAAALGAALSLVPDVEEDGDGHQMAAPERHLEPERVAQAVRALLQDPNYADAAHLVADQLAKLPGAAGVADVVEELPGAAVTATG